VEFHVWLYVVKVIYILVEYLLLFSEVLFMNSVPEDLPHITWEGLEYSDTSYPDVVGYAVGHLDEIASDFESADRENSVMHLYRGNSRENLENIGVDPDSLG